MILCFYVSPANEPGTKVLLAGRLEKVRKEMVFTISSPQELSSSDVNRICRAVAAEAAAIDLRTIEDATQPGQVFDDTGSLAPKDVREFVNGMGLTMRGIREITVLSESWSA
jgi:hypothetical protein